MKNTQGRQARELTEYVSCFEWARANGLSSRGWFHIKGGRGVARLKACRLLAGLKTLHRSVFFTPVIELAHAPDIN